MKLRHACYVLTCEEDPFYADSTVLSISLLRRLYPSVQVTLLTDIRSRQQLLRLAPSLLNLVDECLVEDTPDYQAIPRSRYLKTRLRNLVSGDYVFIDSDALPVREFHDGWTESFDYAAVLDRNEQRPFPHFPKWVVPYYQDLGWDHPTTHYFNSGVTFWRDTPAARALSEMWQVQWKTFYETTQIHQDQPSLNHCIQHLMPTVKVLDVSYNAMVDASPWFAREARLLHYYASLRTLSEGSLLGYLVTYWRKHAAIDWHTVDRIVSEGSAWVTPPERLDVLLATRKYREALQLVPKKAWRLLKTPELWLDSVKHGLLKRKFPK